MIVILIAILYGSDKDLVLWYRYMVYWVVLCGVLLCRFWVV